MFNWLKKEQPQKPVIEKTNAGLFTTASEGGLPRSKRIREAFQNTFKTSAVDHIKDGTMDSIDSVKQAMTYNMGGIPDNQLSWYGSQGFIGYQACAMISQHWLVSKACTIPARDAMRKGYEITVNDGQEISPEILDYMRKRDKFYRLNQNLVEFVKMGRVFGIRIVMFKIESTDPLYYEKPYNPDGIVKGSYKGMSQIDPYWMSPELNHLSASDPSAIGFYEPTFWRIGSLRVHKSHLIIMRGDEVADILKPTYLYGGVSIPQKIYERVYAAERTANEAPQLVMTKRTNVYQTDITAAMMNQSKTESKLMEWAYYRDNYGVKMIDKEDEAMQQFDTALGDLDATIMTQYQLVASIANVPATKLLGTSPKGFNASGEYEEASYREELESIQSFDMTPLIERHHEILIRSEINPKFGVLFTTECVFNPLDSLTEVEQADTNLKKAQTAQALMAVGAIDGFDERSRIIADAKSGYSGLLLEEEDNEDIQEEV
jgi:phage-related protein (TIGR01555 family)